MRTVYLRFTSRQKLNDTIMVELENEAGKLRYIGHLSETQKGDGTLFKGNIATVWTKCIDMSDALRQISERFPNDYVQVVR